MSETTLTRRAAHGLGLAWQRPTFDLWPLLLLGSVLAGCAWALAAAQIGSGDYGHWLVTARPYIGETVPDYRSASAVPPVIPFLLSVAVRVTGDPLVAVHVFAVLLLMALGLS